MNDLRTQLRTYLVETSTPVDVDRLITSIAEYETVVPTRKSARNRVRPVIVFAAALLVALVVIGLASLVMQGDSSDLIDEPTVTTTVPIVPLTEAEPARILTPAATTSVAVSESGELWIGTDEAVFRFANGEWTRLESPQVLDLAIGADGTIWGATPDGVIGLDGSEWETRTSGQTPSNARDLTITPDGSVWTSGGPGVHRWDGQKWEMAEDAVPRTVDDANQRTVAKYRAPPYGQMWFPADGSFYDAYPPYLTSVGSSSDGTIWVGSWADSYGFGEYGSVGGLTRFDGDNWVEIPLPGGESNPVYNLAVAPDGTVWVVIVEWSLRTPKGIWSLARFDGDGWTVFTETDGMPQHLVYSMAVGHDGVVWITQHEMAEPGLIPHGVFAFDGHLWTHFLDGEPVWDIEVGPDGTVWLAGNDLCTIDRKLNPSAR
jgi:hypothetical protein